LRPRDFRQPLEPNCAWRRVLIPLKMTAHQTNLMMFAI
jgi:hypothetical protein